MSYTTSAKVEYGGKRVASNRIPALGSVLSRTIFGSKRVPREPGRGTAKEVSEARRSRKRAKKCRTGVAAGR